MSQKSAHFPPPSNSEPERPEQSVVVAVPSYRFGRRPADWIRVQLFQPGGSVAVLCLWTEQIASAGTLGSVPTFKGVSGERYGEERRCGSEQLSSEESDTVKGVFGFFVRRGRELSITSEQQTL